MSHVLSYWNKRITDEDLRYLSGIKYLDLRHDDQITDKGLKYLSGI